MRTDPPCLQYFCKNGENLEVFSRGMSASMKVFVKSKMNSFLSAVDGVLDIQEANVCVLNYINYFN